MITIILNEERSSNVPFFHESDEGLSSNEINMYRRAFMRYKHHVSQVNTINGNKHTEETRWFDVNMYLEFMTIFGEEVQGLEIRRLKYNEQHSISSELRIRSEP